MKRLNNYNRARVPALVTLTVGLAAGLAAASAHASPAHQTAPRASWRPRAAASAPAASTSVILKLTASGLTPARQAALTRLGADVTRRFDFIGAVAATVPHRHLAQVAALPFVTHLSMDGLVKKCDEFTDASSGADTAYQQYGLTGSGVTVAVVDSGIAPSADFGGSSRDSRLQGAISFVPNDSNINDTCGHGTHVAGIIAGDGSKSSGFGYTHTYYGAARGANLVNVRVLDQYGLGSVSTVLAGLQWVVTHKNDNRNAPIRVINLSLGHPVGESYKTDPLCQAVEAAYRAGIVVVCAAGNNGRVGLVQVKGASNEGWGTNYGSINSPGNDPYVITVGATKSNDGVRAHDTIATYSGRGPSRLDLVLKPDIIAPGNKVISVCSNGSTLDTYAGGTNDIPMSTYCRFPISMPSWSYFRLSGTSMATPVVAGAAALLLQASPNLSPDTVKARLMVSADKWAAPDSKGNPTGQADPCTYGAGYLDIPAALQSTVTASQPALSPTLVTDSKGNVSINASGITSASHIIWGTGTVNDLHIIWGTNAISGASTLTASHIIWGTTSVFTSSTTFAFSTSAVDLTSNALYGEGAVVQTFQPNACPEQEAGD